ncbi:hypothetical protein ACVT98_20290 [Vibrio campbellii]|uniref:hypothetical protein n=1 Tax=Vibrio campbellii TaxID=680 RepID=UPI0040575F77
MAACPAWAQTHFIDINLTDAENQKFINAIPTDFTLEPNQVDALIEHGYQTIAKEKALRLSRDTHSQ